MGIIEKVPVDFYGKSGRKYPFEAYSLDTEFPDIQGVYIFTKRVTTNRKAKNYIRLYNTFAKL